MANDELKAMGQMANLPIGELFRSVALGIAEAQTKLDQSSMAVAELMSGVRVGQNGQTTDSRVYFGAHLDEQTKTMVPDRLSMIELGFTPTFYQFVDTVIEIKVAMSIAKMAQPDQTAGGAPIYAVTTTPVDATYASSYNFSAEFSSVIKTKLVPIPPPALLEERIQQQMRDQRVSKEVRKPTSGLKIKLPNSVPPDRPRTGGGDPDPKVQKTTLSIAQSRLKSTLGLDILNRESQVSILPEGASIEFKTVSGKPDQTASALANRLNEVMSQFLNAATNAENQVVVTFLKPGDYDFVPDKNSRTGKTRIEVD